MPRDRTGHCSARYERKNIMEKIIVIAVLTAVFLALAAADTVNKMKNEKNAGENEKR